LGLSLFWHPEINALWTASVESNGMINIASERLQKIGVITEAVAKRFSPLGCRPLENSRGWRANGVFSNTGGTTSA
jgi:hypothetical protein